MCAAFHQCSTRKAAWCSEEGSPHWHWEGGLSNWEYWPGLMALQLHTAQDLDGNHMHTL